jgi:hypothetical protein
MHPSHHDWIDFDEVRAIREQNHYFIWHDLYTEVGEQGASEWRMYDTEVYHQEGHQMIEDFLHCVDNNLPFKYAAQEDRMYW